MIHNLIKTLGLAGLTVLFCPAALIVPCASALGQTKAPEAEPAPPPVFGLMVVRLGEDQFVEDFDREQVFALVVQLMASAKDPFAQEPPAVQAISD